MSVSYEFSGGGGGRHSKKLFKKRSRLDVRKFMFSNRIVDKWNSLTLVLTVQR